MTKTPPGIYLVNASGEMSALAVEGGSGDRALLREALAEEGVDLQGRNYTAEPDRCPEVADALIEAIERYDTDEGAPVGDVVGTVVEDHPQSTTFDVLRGLKQRADVYAPAADTLRVIE